MIRWRAVRKYVDKENISATPILNAEADDVFRTVAKRSSKKGNSRIFNCISGLGDLKKRSQKIC